MFSPSAIADFLACKHLAGLERGVRDGAIKRPYQFEDPGVEVLRKLGLDHEEKFLGRLQEEGKEVVTIPDDVSRSDKARLTMEAMKAGAEVIYQASFYQSSVNQPNLNQSNAYQPSSNQSDVDQQSF